MNSSIPKNVQQHVSLAPYTTLKIGGPAEFFTEVTDVDQLEVLAAWARTTHASITVLGGGSNVLVADDGLPGLVLAVRNRGITLIDESEESVVVKVAAGENWDDLVEYCITKMWWGLENLSGIPGSVGATPIQNVGAYGAEVADCIHAVETFDVSTGHHAVFTNADCQFSYRNSFFKSEAGRHYVVTSVAFELSKKPKPNLRYKDLQVYFESQIYEPRLSDIRRAVLAIRAGKFPDLNSVGTAGSFFKNPVVSKTHFSTLQKKYPKIVGHETGDGVKVSAAWLIDHVAGLKGVRHGQVGTHEAQALVLVNHGSATAAEVSTFARQIIDDVHKKTQVTLEPEVRFYPQTYGKT